MNWQQLLLGTTADVDIEPYLTYKEFKILKLTYDDGWTMKRIQTEIQYSADEIKKSKIRALKHIEQHRDEIIRDSVEMHALEIENENFKNELSFLQEKINDRIVKNNIILNNNYDMIVNMIYRECNKQLKEVIK